MDQENEDNRFLNFFQLQSDQGGRERENIVKHLLSGKFETKFPDHIKKVDTKLKILAEEPTLFQVYKRSDLIRKLENSNQFDWQEKHVRNSLYAIYADEKVQNSQLMVQDLAQTRKHSKRRVRGRLRDLLALFD